MRRLQIQGCLPTLLVLVILIGLGVLAVTFGLAIAAVTLGLVLLAWVVRLFRVLLGGGAPQPPSGPPSGHFEAVPPGWLEREPGGPVVEAGKPDERPTGDAERLGPPRG
jgi:hypothetical protein